MADLHPGDSSPSLPGVLSGVTFAFLLSFGDFLAPLLLGGPSSVMIANIVANLFRDDWPLGAAVAVLILVMVLVVLTVTQRLERRWRVA